MARKFGWVRKLPSGRYQASYISPDGARVNAPTTFTSQANADKWLAAQRTDIERETWKGPTVGTISLRGYAVPWLEQRTTTGQRPRPNPRRNTSRDPEDLAHGHASPIHSRHRCSPTRGDRGHPSGAWTSIA